MSAAGWSKIFIIVALSSCKSLPDSSSESKSFPEKYHSDQFCVENIPRWIKSIEELREKVSSPSHVIPDNGALSEEEEKLATTQMVLDHCRYERTNYGKNDHLPKTSNIKPRSFIETCRILNGVRTCNVHPGTREDGSSFFCRHYSWSNQKQLENSGVRCEVAKIEFSKSLGHAAVTIKVESKYKNLDRYCLAEPQFNMIIECWYVNGGTVPRTYPDHVIHAIDRKFHKKNYRSGLDNPWQPWVRGDKDRIPSGKAAEALRQVTGISLKPCYKNYEQDEKKCGQKFHWLTEMFSYDACIDKASDALIKCLKEVK